MCHIGAQNISAIGGVNCGPTDKYSERIGRMIAFGRAVGDCFGAEDFFGKNTLENMAKGKS